MAQKIATVSTVFAACDRLDAANERWNREDVREAVGGGGYVVIDPLIRAWRELKPLREVAPTTPAELLHQVATTLESHISDFVESTESRQVERQQVFDAAVSELSERLAAMESELAEKDASLQAMTADRSGLAQALESSQKTIEDQKVANAKLMTENDGLRGQVSRMGSEHKEALAKLNADARELVRTHKKESARANDAHAEALASQRMEMKEAAEQTENRLMMLLDKERQAGKESTARLAEKLADMSEKAQSRREKAIALEVTIRELKGENGKLDLALAESTAQCSELSAALERQQTQTSSIQSEFEAYKKDYEISGNLGEIQAAVSAMQVQLAERGNDKGKAG